MIEVLPLKSHAAETQIAMVSGDYESAVAVMKQAVLEVGLSVETDETESGRLVVSCPNSDGDALIVFVTFVPRTELPGQKFQLNVDADAENQLEIAKARELMEAFSRCAKASATGTLPQRSPQLDSSDLWISGLGTVAGESRFKHVCPECGTSSSISASFANKLGKCDECGFPCNLVPSSWDTEKR